MKGFLSLSEFLGHFPPVEISRDEFCHKFRVSYKSVPSLHQLFNLECPTVIKDTNDKRYIKREAIIDYFYDIVVTNRHKYLTEFYNSYFALHSPYELKWDLPVTKSIQTGDDPNGVILPGYRQLGDESDESDQLSELDDILDHQLPSISLQKNDHSRIVIRNLNYIDLLHKTCITNSVKSGVPFWQSLLDVYNNFLLADRMFCPSSLDQFLSPKNKSSVEGDVNYNIFYYLYQAYQPKASIINPYTLNWIFKHQMVPRYATNATGLRMLTPVLSWCSYLMAFMHAPQWTEYVGIDVMPTVCERAGYLFDYYKSIRDSLKPADQLILDCKKMKIYNTPSESLLYNNKFLNQYYEYFDSVIMCPPYYNMEIYPCGKQSIDSFPTYDAWLAGYWEQTVIMSWMCLKPGGRFLFIINDYTSLQGEYYPLIRDLNRITLRYFDLVGAYELVNRGSPLRVNQKARTEMLFVYEK